MDDDKPKYNYLAEAQCKTCPRVITYPKGTRPIPTICSACLTSTPDPATPNDGATPSGAALVADGGDRNAAYGHPRENFGRICKIWNALLSDKLKPGEEITPNDHGLMMIGVKMAREVHKQQPDNRTDICGYAVCLDRLDEPLAVPAVCGVADCDAKLHHKLSIFSGICHNCRTGNPPPDAKPKIRLKQTADGAACAACGGVAGWGKASLSWFCDNEHCPQFCEVAE